MRFIKMHGLGNDYVYVNAFEEDVPDPASVAIRVSDRHFGIGSDGLILVAPPEEGVDAKVRMRMFNADGSESEMCGNGIRCVCKFAHDQGICTDNPMRIQTGNGVLTLDYTTDADGKVELVTVNMGEPILAAAKVPVDFPNQDPDKPLVDQPLHDLFQWPAEVAADWIAECGFETKLTAVSMGNPHVVLYCDDVDAVELDKVGPAFEYHKVFPNRINAHFVQVVKPDEVIIRHWERGSGMTLACGTGACAVCVAGVLTGKSDRKITAHLPGGDLILEWRESDNKVYMTGPAIEVYHGKIEL